MEALTVYETTKRNTQNFIDKMKELEVRTKSDMKFLVDQAIASAQTEITLAGLLGVADSDMSELAQKLKQNPNYAFDNQVFFGNLSNPNDMIACDFEMRDDVVYQVKDDAEATEEVENQEAPVEVKPKRKQSPRRVKIPGVSVKLDECEVFISFARLTKLDEKRKEVKDNCQKCIDDFTK